jgi:TolB-like protein/Tfp pilus assembly protein PilF
MTTPGYQRFFAELKRRRVFRVMAVYGFVGFVLLQIVDLAVPALLLPEWTYRFVALILLLGLPIAILLAWAFEMTPEGVQRATEAAPGELGAIIAQPASRHWFAGVLALVGVVALVGGAWWVGSQSASVADADPTTGPVFASIAVLPFVNMSDDASNEYFSDGISEELLNLLAKIPDLHVAARTSSFSFKGQGIEVTEIADRLNVAHVLEGSVRKADNEVRITAQLIRAEDGFHVWSDTWDRTLQDVFAIQDEIAADVTERLKVTLLGAAPTAEETDPEAYALFLQARQLGRQRSGEAYERAIVLYEQALAIEPEYTAAWVGLGNTYVSQASGGFRPVDEGNRLAREAANRALSIDPDNAEAYATLSSIADVYENDLAAAARHLERALELDPTNTNILITAAGLASSLGRLDEAIALQEYVVARDPVNPSGHSTLGVYYLFAGRLDESIASSRTALDLSPGRENATMLIGWALLEKGEPEAALSAIQDEPSEFWRLGGLVGAYHALGRFAESDAGLANLIEDYEHSAAANIAVLYAFRGDADGAFEWLDKAVQYRDAGLSEISSISTFANLHDDPRWLPFLESIGRSPEQLAAIDFEVRVPQ